MKQEVFAEFCARPGPASAPYRPDPGQLWNRESGYIGMVARQGQHGTFPEGIQVERAVRSLVEQ
jgi:hypothetical protein